MLAIKTRRPSEYVPQFVPAIVAIAVDTEVVAAASPARALQAELEARLFQAPAAPLPVAGRSLRWRAAMIGVATLVCWTPIVAAGWLVLA